MASARCLGGRAGSGVRGRMAQGRGALYPSSESYVSPHQVWRSGGLEFYKGIPCTILPLKTPGQAYHPLLPTVACGARRARAQKH